MTIYDCLWDTLTETTNMFTTSEPVYVELHWKVFIDSVSFSSDIHCSACYHVCTYHMCSLFSHWAHVLWSNASLCLPCMFLFVGISLHSISLILAPKPITHLQCIEQLASLLNQFCQVNKAIISWWSFSHTGHFFVTKILLLIFHQLA